MFVGWFILFLGFCFSSVSKDIMSRGLWRMSQIIKPEWWASEQSYNMSIVCNVLWNFRKKQSLPFLFIEFSVLDWREISVYRETILHLVIIALYCLKMCDRDEDSEKQKDKITCLRPFSQQMACSDCKAKQAGCCNSSIWNPEKCLSAWATLCRKHRLETYCVVSLR